MTNGGRLTLINKPFTNRLGYVLDNMFRKLLLLDDTLSRKMTLSYQSYDNELEGACTVCDATCAFPEALSAGKNARVTLLKPHALKHVATRGDS